MFRYLNKFKIFAILSILIFISCSEETILYNEIENPDSTIKTASLPQTQNKVYQSFPSFSSNSKLQFGDVKESDNLFSLVQMTLFSGNIPPVSLVDLLADAVFTIKSDKVLINNCLKDGLVMTMFKLEGFGSKALNSWLKEMQRNKMLRLFGIAETDDGELYVSEHARN
mgnify:CR=1 FL=1